MRILSFLRAFASLRLCVKLLFLLPIALQSAEQPAADFEAANRFYEKGEYSAAISAYQRLISNGRASSAILFNLGNAHFKNGQIGKAILAYRQAEQLAPRDPDIRANLRFARGAVPGNNLRVTAWDRLLSRATLNEVGAFYTLAIWAWFGLLALGQWRPEWKSSLRPWIFSSALLTILFSAWLIRAVLERSSNRVAVVTVPASAVRFGPLEESQISFNVRDGNELRVLGQKDAWLQVTDSANRSGWILTNDVTQLR